MLFPVFLFIIKKYDNSGKIHEKILQNREEYGTIQRIIFIFRGAVCTNYPLQTVFLKRS